MSISKFSANKIFDGNQWLTEPSVIITDHDGRILDVSNSPNDFDEAQHVEGVISPGFINCHCHTELSHLKNLIPEHTGLVPFLTQVSTKRFFSKELINESAHAAFDEMYKGGIVGVGDISNTTDSIDAKLFSSMHCYNFIEALGLAPELATERMIVAETVQQQYQAALPWQQTVVVPHAPYSISSNLFEKINLASAGRTISIHNQETEAENLLFETGGGPFLELFSRLKMDYSTLRFTGRRSVFSYLPFLTHPKRIILVHNTFTQEEDIDFIQDHALQHHQHIVICLCPNANLYIENKLPPVEFFMNRGLDIVLGTDSYASNHQLNILSEMYTLQKAYKLPLATLLLWSCANGAAALDMNHLLGSISPGKQPGLVALEYLDNNENITDKTRVRKLM